MNLPDPEAIRRPVTYGDGAVTAVPDLVASFGARRVLLVTGARSFEASGAARIMPELARTAEIHRWTDFRPNTDAEDVVAGLDVVDEFRPDLVVAVGGGSAMDMAKLLCAYEPTTDRDAVMRAIRGGGRIGSRRLRLVMAPSTSGSGSEATRFAVVYIGATKHSIAGPAMLPDAVVLDPELALSGSPYQRATSGIDAVAQAIESLWAAGSTDRSRQFARHALRLLLANVERFVNAPTGSSARAMAIGSHLAGRAIDLSRTTAAHALSYGITKGYGISHGHAVALTLGLFIEAHARAEPSRLQPGIPPARHAQAMHEVLGRLGTPDGAQARRRWGSLLERIGLESSLSRVGVTSHRELAAAVNVERLGNNPVAFTEGQLTDLLTTAG